MNQLIAILANDWKYLQLAFQYLEMKLPMTIFPPSKEGFSLR